MADEAVWRKINQTNKTKKWFSSHKGISDSMGVAKGGWLGGWFVVIVSSSFYSCILFFCCYCTFCRQSIRMCRCPG